MEKLYKDGAPLYHQASAKSLNGPQGSSQFFVTTLEEFSHFKPAQVQAIFRNRHILLLGRPPEGVKFDKDGLSRLGSLTASRFIQGSEILISILLLG
jgi:hypothetical protein